MRIKQLPLQALKKNGKIDGRTKRWVKTPSFTGLYRQGNMGGSIRYRKSKRPFSSQKAQHMVLKSDECRPGFHFTHPSVKLKIEAIAQATAKKMHLKLQKIAINFNHIHMLGYGKDREAQANFLRVFAGIIAKRMKKWAAKKGIPLKSKNFWSARPFTKLVSFGKQWKAVLRYIEKNRQEAEGFIAYTERNHPIQKIIAKIERRIQSLHSTA